MRAEGGSDLHQRSRLKLGKLLFMIGALKSNSCTIKHCKERAFYYTEPINRLIAEEYVAGGSVSFFMLDIVQNYINGERSDQIK